MVAVESIIKPLKPKGKGWSIIPINYRDELVASYPHVGYIHEETGLVVISAVEVANDANDIERGPEYHLSISKYPQQRCSSNKAKWALRQFNCEGAEEDNHVPNGIVRNFWRPVAEKLIGLECPCKDKEPVIKENKGDYIWRPVSNV